MTDSERVAPGWPGIQPRWTSSAKTGAGTALSLSSRVWFTLSHGILNEVYYPRVDQACIRDLGLIVTNGVDYFSEEKGHCRFTNTPVTPGIPVYELRNTAIDGRYRIEKEVFTDPYRNVVLQKVRLVPLQGRLSDYRLYALLAPHLANGGAGNTGWIGDYKGERMLFAEHNQTALAFGCSVPWQKMSVGFVGFSDGWQDLAKNYQMAWAYTWAENGNIALTGEIDLVSSGGEFILALGLGEIWAEAGQHTRSSLITSYEKLREHYVAGWTEWQNSLLKLDETPRERDLYRASAAVLRTHESKDFLGGVIASLSIPWGFDKGDEDLGGYHLVWPRDLVETAFGFLAAGARSDAIRVLHYLESTQEADGHWGQNMWLDGRPYWVGLQMDESAFPILLVDRLRRDAPEDFGELDRWWSLVHRAAGFLVRNGPVTEQDRWEEDPGYSPFTLAVEISALLAAADFAEAIGEKTIARYLRDSADNWNDNIERWTYAIGTDVARQIGVEGYYVRIAPPEGEGATSPLQGFVPIKNRPAGQSSEAAIHLISPDALALVRFGLRAPDDPRILNTLKVIDALLRVKLPQGFCWYRYNGDGYGEQQDGAPFEGQGIGRPWPLLAGERAHYELAAGHESVALELLKVMELSTEGGRLLPEQVWDEADLPERELFTGKPSGSACPLVWAHSEYIKLRRSLRDGQIFDQPSQPKQRYLIENRKSPYFAWRFNNKCQSMPQGKILRILLRGPALVHWSFDGWKSTLDTETRDTGLGTHVADVPSEMLAPGAHIVFTFYWRREQRWQGLDYHVVVEA
ncbi:MAG TPA: glucan 1,4-alpha-glucosidase [Terriglobales bacterium]|nr:glucan 1,4-alpha-glucosidase [Terriglobales bacterium]